MGVSRCLGSLSTRPSLKLKVDFGPFVSTNHVISMGNAMLRLYLNCLATMVVTMRWTIFFSEGCHWIQCCRGWKSISLHTVNGDCNVGYHVLLLECSGVYLKANQFIGASPIYFYMHLIKARDSEKETKRERSLEMMLFAVEETADIWVRKGKKTQGGYESDPQMLVYMSYRRRQTWHFACTKEKLKPTRCIKDAPSWY